MKGHIRRFILEGGDFEATALDLFRWQREHNPPYAAFAGSDPIRHWQDIPAVPVALFRDVVFGCFPPEQARIHFRTSGTTAGTRGLHALVDTEIYDLAAELHADTCLGGPVPREGVSLVPTAPDSSLGHMCNRFSPALRPCFSSEGVDTVRAWHALAQAQTPLFVPGTAFAWDALLTRPPDDPCLQLPGTVVMVTGGFKGRAHQLDRPDLLRRIGQMLPGARVVEEYGMTELSSQMWAVPASTPFRPPPWLGVYTVDPGTGEPSEEGLLRFVDLANHQTVLAIETEDLGRVDHQGRVTLLGRLTGATPRGCSLTAEEAHGR